MLTGGKTTHLASLMKDQVSSNLNSTLFTYIWKIAIITVNFFWHYFQGVVVAFDKSEPKIEKLRANCDRLGIRCVKSYVYDGVKAVDPDKLWDAENSEWRKKRHSANLSWFLWRLFHRPWVVECVYHVNTKLKQSNKFVCSQNGLVWPCNWKFFLTDISHIKYFFFGWTSSCLNPSRHSLLVIYFRTFNFQILSHFQSSVSDF